MGLFDKAKDLLTEHADKVSEGIDRAGDLIDERTGGSYVDQVDQGQDFARRRLADFTGTHESGTNELGANESNPNESSANESRGNESGRGDRAPGQETQRQPKPERHGAEPSPTRRVCPG